MAKIIEKKNGEAGSLFEALLFVSKAMEKKDATRPYMNTINFSRGEQGGKHEDKIFIAATDGRRLHIVWFLAEGITVVHSAWGNQEMGSFSVKVNAKEIIILEPKDMNFPNWRKIISEEAIVQPTNDHEWTALTEQQEHDFDPEHLEEALFALSSADILVNHKYIEDLGKNAFSVYQFKNNAESSVLFSQRRRILAKSAIIMPKMKDANGKSSYFLVRPVKEDKKPEEAAEAAKITLAQEYENTWKEQEDIPVTIGSAVLFEKDNEIKAGVVIGSDRVSEHMTPPSIIWIVECDGVEYGVHQDDPIIVRKQAAADDGVKDNCSGLPCENKCGNCPAEEASQDASSAADSI